MSDEELVKKYGPPIRTAHLNIPKGFHYPRRLELGFVENYLIQNYYVRIGRKESDVEPLPAELIRKLEERCRYLSSQLIPRHDSMAYPIGQLSNRWHQNISDFNCSRAPRGNDLVLVIGCNEGWEVERLNKWNKKVIGVDIVPSVVKYGREKNGLDLRLMDMHQLDFEDETFDMVFIKGTLEHSHKPTVVLSEIIRVLKPLGKIFINVPPDLRNPPSWNGEIGYEFTHQWKTNVPDIYDKVSEAGFVDITMGEVDLREFEGEGSWPPSNSYEIIVLARKPGENPIETLRLTP